MGKDDSGEPAAKKLKQSQLSFKSPKHNNSLKSREVSPIKDGINQCKSQKIHSSDSLKLNDDSECQLSNVPCNENGSRNLPLEKTSGSEGQNENKENDPEKSNVLESTGKSSTDKKSTCEDDSPMEIDDPPLNNVTSLITQISNPVVESDSCKSDNKTTEDISDMSPSLDNPTSPSKESKVNPEISTVNITNAEDALDASATSANESNISISSDSEMESGTTSPSSTPVTPKTPNSNTKRQMTPKMLKRHEESVRKKKLEEQRKAEKRAKKEAMKNERIKMKKEEEEKKKQVLEEKKKKRIADLELKNEEKRLKQEDKRQKKEKEDEEKKRKIEKKAEESKKEEEKKAQEERKKERAQAAFASFFKKKPVCSSGNTGSEDACTESPAFMPFPVKSDMRVAAIVRRQLSENERSGLESVMNGDRTSESYLKDIKRDCYTRGCSSATWPAPVSDDLHDCIIIEAQVEDKGEENAEQVLDKSDHAKTTSRGKLLQFCENRRPAYFGTWTKISQEVSGRTPFAKDGKGVLDYEVDSDSEWEEEEEGEDLETVKDDDNEGQDQDEEEVEGGENGYILDNTFVPHGYLSDEEQPDEEDLQESVEKQDRLVAMKEEFDEEMKQGGAQALKPKLLGCLWVSNSTTQVSKGSLYEALLAHRAVWDESKGVEGISMEPDSTPCQEKSPTQTPPSKKLPPIVLQEIANMVDGNRWPLSKLVREIGDVLLQARPQNTISRLALTRAIKQMAAKTLDPKGNSVWTIKPEFRSEFKLQDLEEVPSPVTVSKEKSKKTLLDNFLTGHQQKSDQGTPSPPAKKRISLTPVLQTPPDKKKIEETPTEKKLPAVSITKKKVQFVTLPPRTPGSSPQNRDIPRTPGPWASANKQTSIKPHVDTPRPPINRFLNKTSPAQPVETIELSDSSNP